MSFLKPEDFRVIIIVCKFLQKFFQKQSLSIQRIALHNLGLPTNSGFLPWKDILENISKINSSKLHNCFLPYYTDGGLDEDSKNYFIGNLVSDFGTYTSKKPSNTLVKFIYAPKAVFDYDKDLNLYTISPDEILISSIEEDSKNHNDLCPLLVKIHFVTPKICFTRPVETWMCFGSYIKIEDFSTIKAFYSCSELENAKIISKKLGLCYEVTIQNNYTALMFKNKIGDLQPICWVKGILSHLNYKGIMIEMNRMVFVRYFYLLMINPFIREPDEGMDLTTLIPYARIVKVGKNSCEEN
ncbi:hypothetical protein SteCoe_5209 [Stentor coeruleus]|uniref:Uncharacterized protein n=1 Tax=Stentor coeruleus TaxID=5963 RepID=A0A1R2CT08_9CILI|nr:hypothetical protein SteCoe_5209 [Stentor coeruleus]